MKPSPRLLARARLVRLWDEDWNLCHVILPDDAVRAGDTYTLTQPLEHVTSQWILLEDELVVPQFYMTVEPHHRTRRWIGRLHSWELHKVGDCPQCQHCQQIMLRSVWEHEPDSA